MESSDTMSNTQQKSPKGSVIEKTSIEKKIIIQQATRFVLEYDLVLGLLEKAGINQFFDSKVVAFIMRMLGFLTTLGVACEPTSPLEQKPFEEILKIFCLKNNGLVHKIDLLQILLAFQGICIPKEQYSDLQTKDSIYFKYLDKEVLSFTPSDTDNIFKKVKLFYKNRINSSTSLSSISQDRLKNVDLEEVKCCIQELLKENLSKEKFSSNLNICLTFFQSALKDVHCSHLSRRIGIGSSQEGVLDLNHSDHKAQRSTLFLKPEKSNKSCTSQGSESRGSQSKKKPLPDDQLQAKPIMIKSQFKKRTSELPLKKLSLSFHENKKVLNMSVYSDNNLQNQTYNLSEGEEIQSPEIYRGVGLYNKSIDLERTDIYSKNINRLQAEKDLSVNNIYEVSAKKINSKREDIFERILAKSINMPAPAKKESRNISRSYNRELQDHHVDFEKLKHVIYKVANEFSS